MAEVFISYARKDELDIARHREHVKDFENQFLLSGFLCCGRPERVRRPLNRFIQLLNHSSKLCNAMEGELHNSAPGTGSSKRVLFGGKKLVRYVERTPTPPRVGSYTEFVARLGGQHGNFVKALSIARHRRQTLRQKEDGDTTRLRRPLHDCVCTRLSELQAEFADQKVGQNPTSTPDPRTIARKLACRFASKKASNDEKLFVGIARFLRSA